MEGGEKGGKGRGTTPPHCFLDKSNPGCRAFNGLTNRAKMIGGGRPLKRKFCINAKFTFKGSIGE